MPNCPNCSYDLVLLSHRLKYKCSLCSKIYSQKEVELKSFQEWNQKQRELDRETTKPQTRPKLTEEEKKLKVREYQLKNHKKLKVKASEWRNTNRDDYNTIRRAYWNKRIDHLNTKRRERYSEKAPEILQYQKDWEQKHPYSYRLKRRLIQLREQQKLLALHYLKNDEYKLYTNSFQEVLPTFLLSDLLF